MPFFVLFSCLCYCPRMSKFIVAPMATVVGDASGIVFHCPRNVLYVIVAPMATVVEGVEMEINRREWRHRSTSLTYSPLWRSRTCIGHPKISRSQVGIDLLQRLLFFRSDSSSSAATPLLPCWTGTGKKGCTECFYPNNLGSVSGNFGGYWEEWGCLRKH